MSNADVDLFAGAGGWEEGARPLRLAPLGIEFDATACKTRAARGLRTLQADVAALDPQDFAPVRGLVASAPCQAFSMAGQGAGRAALPFYGEAIAAMLRGNPLDRDALDDGCKDPRGHLVLEPLRWALELRPVWVLLEQVEPVLPLWELMGGGLRSLGYSVWTGVLSAERYGVPQTRKRAILIARRDGVEAREPPATHQRYTPPQKKFEEEPTDALFATAKDRIVHPEDRHLLPWVSMAEALGWTDGVVGFPRLSDTPSNRSTGSVEIDGALTEKARSWTHFRSTNQPNAAVRSIDEPAPTIASGHSTGDRKWIALPSLTAGTGEKEATRAADQPAPTLRFGARLNSVEWSSEPPPSAYNSRDQKDGRTGETNRQRGVDEPAPTIAGESRNDSWVHDRPATTVVCDPRVFPPGGHMANDGRDNSQMVGRSEDAVRVTVEEAAMLQSFPGDYPWQGTRTKKFEQIGNAIPPLLALAVLREVVS